MVTTYSLQPIAPTDLVGDTFNMDDSRLAAFGKYTPEGFLTPGYGESYLFLVGRDDVHNILKTLIENETMVFKMNMFGYDDEELNTAICQKLSDANVRVQITLDKSQAGGVHERRILDQNKQLGPTWYNSIVIGQSETHQISHTKGGVLVGQGIAFEGSTNWSASGEGTGISLKPGPRQPGFKAQNNTLMVTTNPVVISRFGARLDAEHLIGLHQQLAAK